jgi:hypothetical protein
MRWAKQFQSLHSLMAVIFKNYFSKQRCVRRSSRLCIAITFFVRCAHRVVIGAAGITS